MCFSSLGVASSIFLTLLSAMYLSISDITLSHSLSFSFSLPLLHNSLFYFDYIPHNFPLFASIFIYIFSFSGKNIRVLRSFFSRYLLFSLSYNNCFSTNLSLQFKIYIFSSSFLRPDAIFKSTNYDFNIIRPYKASLYIFERVN